MCYDDDKKPEHSIKHRIKWIEDKLYETVTHIVQPIAIKRFMDYYPELEMMSYYTNENPTVYQLGFMKDGKQVRITEELVAVYYEIYKAEYCNYLEEKLGRMSK